MAALAVRVTAMYCEGVGLLGIARARRVEEWVAALAAEKVQLVIVPLPQEVVVQCDESGVYDRSLAVIAVMCEFLRSVSTSDGVGKRTS